VTATIVSLIVAATDAGELAHILPGLAAQGPAAEVVVTGTGDEAALAPAIARHAPGARWVPAQPPGGFARLRNQGAAAASAGWLLFLDDGMGLQRPLALSPQPGVCLAGDDLGLLVAAEDFRRVEGYDEALDDSRAAQADLLLRLAKAGITRAVLPAYGFTRLAAARQAQPRTIEDRLYERVKADLVRLGAPPDADARRALVMHIRATLAQANAGGAPAELYVQFRHARAGASAVRASLTYTVQPAD